MISLSYDVKDHIYSSQKPNVVRIWPISKCYGFWQ